MTNMCTYKKMKILFIVMFCRWKSNSLWCFVLSNILAESPVAKSSPKINRLVSEGFDVTDGPTSMYYYLLAN